uniref:Protein LTV1 homolog n=1 Tax=Elaeophora elaphi TaxID=1147741 RepID=A0A0R3RH20_9BILA
MRSLNFPCTNAPHAPLADAFEVDDFSLDDVEQCCNLQVTNSTNAPLIGGNEISGGSEDEEEMEQDEMDSRTDVINDDSFSEDDDELNKEDEYPELVRTCGESVVETESYDLTVMDTEKDMNTNRKRKADNSATRKKKRVK